MTSVHPLGNLKARQGGNDYAQYTEEETKAQEGKSGVTCVKTVRKVIENISDLGHEE